MDAAAQSEQGEQPDGRCPRRQHGEEPGARAGVSDPHSAPRCGLQVTVEIETHVEAAAAALPGTKVEALREQVEVVDEQPRRTTFERMQHRGQFGIAAGQAYLHRGTRKAILARIGQRRAIGDHATAIARAGFGDGAFEPLDERRSRKLDVRLRHEPRHASRLRTHFLQAFAHRRGLLDFHACTQVALLQGFDLAANFEHRCRPPPVDEQQVGEQQHAAQDGQRQPTIATWHFSAHRRPPVRRHRARPVPPPA